MFTLSPMPTAARIAILASTTNRWGSAVGFSMWGMLGGALHVLVVVVAFFVVPVNRKPSSATAWLLLITIAPFLGVIIFLLIGSPKLPPRRRRLQRRMSDLIAQAIDRASDDQAPAALLSPSVPAVALPHAALAELLPEYDNIMERMAREIEESKRLSNIPTLRFDCSEGISGRRFTRCRVARRPAGQHCYGIV